MAVKLGCTVKQLSESMTSQELSEWIAYNQIDPFTESRADTRQAITSKILVSGLLKKFVDINDLKPVRTPIKEMKPEDMMKVLKDAYGGHN